MTEQKSAAGRTDYGASTGKGNGLAIAAVVLGVVDLIIFAVLVALAATHGGSWYVNFG